jgi:hypothetical protein
MSLMISIVLHFIFSRYIDGKAIEFMHVIIGVDKVSRQLLFLIVVETWKHFETI